MNIKGIGNVPLGQIKYLVLGLSDTSDGPEHYIDVKFDLGSRTQKHYGKIVEEIIRNPDYMAKVVMQDVLKSDSKLRQDLLILLGDSNFPEKTLNLIFCAVEFYCQKTSGHAFKFTENSYGRNLKKITTDLDLNPIAASSEERGKDYYIEPYHDFKFYDLRYFKNENHMNELKESVLWVERIANKKAPRLNEYIKSLELYEETNPGVISLEQVDISIAYCELEGLRVVYNTFKNRDDDLSERIKNIIKGVAFKYKQEVISDDKCRDFLYELKVAAYFLLSGYNVNVSERSDVIIDKDTFVECKKISSDKKLIIRLKDALDQIEEKENAKNGVIYIDITDSIRELKHVSLIVNDEHVNNFYLKCSDPELMLEDNLRNHYYDVVNEHSMNLIQSNWIKICEKLNDSVLVLNVELPVLHFSPIHERMGIIKLSYIITNRIDSRLLFIVENSMRSLSELYPVNTVGRINNSTA